MGLISRFGTWLATLFFNYVGTYFYKYIVNVYKDYKRSQKQKEALEKLEEAIKNGASAEEREKHEKDLLNS